MYEETFRNFEKGPSPKVWWSPSARTRWWSISAGKSEGMIPADQFSREELAQLKVGDRLQVYLEECEDADGNLVLSKKSRQDENLGGIGEKKKRREKHRGENCFPYQGRHDGRYRRQAFLPAHCRSICTRFAT